MYKSLYLIIFGLLTLSLTSCLKDPSAQIEIDKTTVAIDEPVTVTLSNAENYTCIAWGVVFDGEFTDIAGGSSDDLTFSVSFDKIGEATIMAIIKNCKKSDDKEDLCVCEKNHPAASYEVMVTIE